MAAPWRTSRDPIILFGDSITSQGWEAGGWVAALAALFVRRADVLNRGFGGYNTRWALRMLPFVFLPAPNPVLVTIFFGSNDLSSPDLNPRQHVPLDEYHTNLKHIVDYVRRRYTPEVPILLLTPPPISEAGILRHQVEKYADKATGVAERTDEAANRYRKICVAVGAEAGVPVVDLWQAFHTAAGESAGGLSDLLSDGLHPSARGQVVISRALTEAILTHHPALDPARMPPQFPWSADVDWEHPDATFGTELPAEGPTEATCPAPRPPPASP